MLRPRLLPQVMMRLLHVAIFLGAVSCITEFILKFKKVHNVRPACGGLPQYNGD